MAGRAGKPELLRSDIGIDDFDFDARVALCGATRVSNSLVRVVTDGQATVLDELAQVMAGSTAVAVNVTSQGPALYVTSNAGMSLPLPGGVQPGKPLRVNLAAKR